MTRLKGQHSYIHLHKSTGNDICQEVTYLFARNLTLYSINTGDSSPGDKAAAA